MKGIYTSCSNFILMRTIDYFRTDLYCKELGANILDIIEEDDKLHILLDKTIFFPTGGGQSCDKGYLDDYLVTDVYEKDRKIYHVTKKNSSSLNLKVGTKVKLHLDWEHRFLNMQRHAGEHILAGVLYDFFGSTNKGFHMGDNYMTMDITMPKEFNDGILTWDILMKIETEANKILWENHPISIDYYENLDAFKKENIPVRKKVTFLQDITIVTIGNKDNIIDCVACCGTHPKSTSEIGLIKIYDFEPHKGMYRIYFDAGKKALENYQEISFIIRSLKKELSASTSEILSKYVKKCLKERYLRDELFDLNSYFIENEITKIKNKIKENNYYESNRAKKDSANFEEDKNPLEYENIIYLEYKNISLDSLNLLGKKILEETKTDNLNLIFLLYQKNQNIAFILSNNINCKDIISALKNSFPRLKGGGGKTSGRLELNQIDIDIILVNMKKISLN